MIIHLEVKRFLDLEAFDHGLKVFSFRIWLRASFKSLPGWTPRLPILLDTGAPFSVLPRSFWSTLELAHQGFPTGLRGLVPGQAAVIHARFAQVICRLSDAQTISDAIPLWAFLADGEVPLVVGCSGVLDRARLTLDAAHLTGHLEFSS